MMVILFTDIVDSTPTAAALGDERWAAIDQHNERLRVTCATAAATRSSAPATGS